MHNKRMKNGEDLDRWLLTEYIYLPWTRWVQEGGGDLSCERRVSL